jgi:hypothetical protein
LPSEVIDKPSAIHAIKLESISIVNNYKPRIAFKNYYWRMPRDASRGWDDTWKEINELVIQANEKLYYKYLEQQRRGEYIHA